MATGPATGRPGGSTSSAGGSRVQYSGVSLGQASRAAQSGGLGLSTQRKAANNRVIRAYRNKQLNRNKAFAANWASKTRVTAKAGCYPSTQIYGGKSAAKKWLCGVDGQITYREGNHVVHHSELRVFVEGVEVTPYLEGQVQWTYETTGGMNSCTFSLNNAFDAFILTPLNVCSGLDLSGWRVALDKKRRLITSPYRSSRHTDETSKYQIYKAKYRRVAPGTDHAAVDESGMWLYPLSPYKTIFNRHDCVRVFYRLPHVTGAAKRDHSAYEQLWAPAFTGFINQYGYTDDLVDGHRQVQIACYDYKGLLQGMRVRATVGNLVSDGSSADNDARTDPISRGLTQGPNKFASAVAIKDTVCYNTAAGLQIHLDWHKWYKSKSGLRIITEARTNGVIDTAKMQKITEQVKAEIADYVNRKICPHIKGIARAISTTQLLLGTVWLLRRTQDSKNALVLSKAANSKVKDPKDAVSALAGYLAPADSTGPGGRGYRIAYWLDKFKSVPVNIAAGKNPTLDLRSTTGDLAQLAVQQTLGTSTLKLDKTLYNDLRFSLRDPYKGLHTLLARDLELYVKGVADQVLIRIQNLANDSKAVGGASNVLSPPNDVRRPLMRRSDAKNRINSLHDALALRLAMSYYMNNDYARAKALERDDLPRLVRKLNSAIYTLLENARLYEIQYLRELKTKKSLRTGSQVNNLLDAYERARASALTQKQYVANTWAELIKKEPRFDKQNAGIFADLVRSLRQDVHPLSGFSYEQAVLWLITTHSSVTPGVLKHFARYGQTNELQDWNKTIVFGIQGRPLTFGEVTEIGKGTISEIVASKAPFSPFNVFLHMLIPKEGTGAQTIVQSNIQGNLAASQDYNHSTRLTLLNEVSELLDYQFFVSPIGDLIFEFPHYNAYPTDFGPVFGGAYTVQRELKRSDIKEETGELNTAWVITGLENDLAVQRAVDGGGAATKNLLQVHVIIAPMLARRHGVKVARINLRIPGVGAAVKTHGVAGGIDALNVYGLLQIQRQLGEYEQVSFEHPFRPYILPNRTMWLVHRQRMGMVKSVRYSMEPPDGACTCNVTLGYIRWLFRDGTFRTIAGGHRMPVDYSGIYTGQVNYLVRLGNTLPNTGAQINSGSVSSALMAAARSATPEALADDSRKLREAYQKTQGRRLGYAASSLSCGSALRDRLTESALSFGGEALALTRQRGTYPANASGSGGVAGTMPATKRPQGTVGARTYRSPPGQGDRSEAVTMDNTALKNLNDKKAKQGTKKINYLAKFHNPWPYGHLVGGKSVRSVNNFGYIRTYQRGYLDQHYASGSGSYIPSNKKTYLKKWYAPDRTVGCWHHGVDLPGDKKELLAPIPLFDMDHVLTIGWGKSIKIYTTKAFKGDSWTAKFAKFHKGKVQPFAYEVKPGGVAEFKWKLFAHEMSFWINAQQNKKIYSVNRWKRIIPDGSFAYKFGVGSGLVLSGWGYVKNPAGDGQLLCQLVWRHLNEIDTVPGGDGFYGQNKAGTRTAKKGATIARSGSTGAARAHAHIEMLVAPPGTKGSDKSAYKDARLATEQYLRTQWYLKLTGGNVNSTSMAKQWQIYFQKVNSVRAKKGLPLVILNDLDKAVDFLIKNSSYYKNVTKKPTLFWTNVLMFFKPEELVKGIKNLYDAQFADVFYQRTVKPVSRDSSTTYICQLIGNREQIKLQVEYNSCVAKAKRSQPSKNRGKELKNCKATFTVAEKNLRRVQIRQRKETETMLANAVKRQNKADRKPGVPA